MKSTPPSTRSFSQSLSFHSASKSRWWCHCSLTGGVTPQSRGTRRWWGWGFWRGWRWGSSEGNRVGQAVVEWSNPTWHHSAPHSVRIPLRILHVPLTCLLTSLSGSLEKMDPFLFAVSLGSFITSVSLCLWYIILILFNVSTFSNYLNVYSFTIVLQYRKQCIYVIQSNFISLIPASILSLSFWLIEHLILLLVHIKIIQIVAFIVKVRWLNHNSHRNQWKCWKTWKCRESSEKNSELIPSWPVLHPSAKFCVTHYCTFGVILLTNKRTNKW